MTFSGSSCSRAAVFEGEERPLTIHEVQIPKLESGEALVRITCCTICGSDLHTFTGRRSGPVPSVLGHEIIGRIESFGSQPMQDLRGNPLEFDARVTWSVAASCGSCSLCERGIPQKCDSLLKYGHEAFDAYPLSGGLADYCVLKKGTAIVRLPDSITDGIACPANCATATVAAAFRRAGRIEGKRVLIFGAGMLGLTATAFGSVANANEVVVCDVDATRLERAVTFGATAVELATGDGLSNRGADFDVVFEMSGNSEAVESAIQAADIGATIVLVGSVSPSDPVSLDPELVVRRLLSLHGVHNYCPNDLVAAVDFLANHGHRFPFDELIERTFDLADVQEGFQYAVAKRPVRVAIIP